MSDRRPDRIYGLIVREGRVFVTRHGGAPCLPGGVFRPLAEDRKAELNAHLFDQLGIDAQAIWAQGAFDYRHPAEPAEAFSGFYSVWDYEGEVADDAGEWLDADGVSKADLPPPVKILLTSVLDTKAIKTT